MEKAFDDDGLIYANGVDATTGDYLVKAMSFDDLLQMAKGVPEPKIAAVPQPGDRRGFLEFRFGPDLNNLASAGWGVVFSPDTRQEIRTALIPLLTLRRQQAGDLYYEITIDPDETVEAFLRRRGGIIGHLDPAQTPYYLMLVGDPEGIPFSFQGGNSGDTHLIQ